MITLRAPAKVNLGLRILGNRPDGFHDIRSIFCPVTLWDTVSVKLSPGKGITLKSSGIPSPEGPDNIAWKAADLFMAADGRSWAVSIGLHKRIPSPGGLGGGSSDAAAVLKALARLTGSAVPLEPLALELGSDVPFFLGTGPALVEGRGERLTPVRVPFFHGVLVDSGEPVPTPWAYGLWDAADLTETGATYDDSPLEMAQWHEGKPYPADLRNDFLPLLSSRLPGLERACRALSSLTGDWGLSGSGPVVFALFRTAAEAKRAVEVLGNSFTRVYAVEPT